MRYRIKKRVNLLTNKMAYIVEMPLCESIDSWIMCAYEDERNERRAAVFDTYEDALAYAKNGGVIGERIIWEGNDDE